MHIGTACVLKAYFFRFFLDFGAILGANMASSWAHMGPSRTPKLAHVQPSQAYEVKLWKKVKLWRAKTELLTQGRLVRDLFWLCICPAD